jgi:lysophospholipase L1-like esterase
MLSVAKLGPVGRARQAACCLALLLAACGGGTQVEKFVPNRVLVFGDETSVIDDTGATANGRKYTVNGFGTDGITPDCRVNAVWVQYLAGHWGIVFPQCNPTAAATTSRIYAANGAKVGDLAAQISAAGALGNKDLTTVLVGVNDIVELYAQYPASSEVALKAQAESRATALAAQIKRITATGAKVVFVTIPELGYSPFAKIENTNHAGEDRAGLLTRLSAAFNARLRTAVSTSSSPSFIDGHQGVQVLGDELFRAIAASAGLSGSAYFNASVGICDAAKAPNVIDCNNSTDTAVSTLITATSTPALVTGGTAFNYLWADGLHLSPGGHGTLGTTAANRTNANPL